MMKQVLLHDDFLLGSFLGAGLVIVSEQGFGYHGFVRNIRDAVAATVRDRNPA